MQQSHDHNCVTMMISDSHTHTTYSSDVPNDRPAKVADMCAAAAAKGLSYFAITDHYDIEHYKRGIYPPFPFDAWMHDIEKMREEYRGRMYVAAGLEYGEPYLFPDDIPETVNKVPFDLILGSVHYLPGKTGFIHYTYTDMTDEERIALFDAYLDAWETLVHTPGIDVFTHPTYPLRYCLRRGIPFPIEYWEERMRVMLAHIVERGCGLEYNAAAYRSPNMGIPDHTMETVLRWYKEVGGEIITFASDAHFSKDIAAHYEFCMRVLSELGFRYAAVYKNHNPEFYRIK